MTAETLHDAIGQLPCELIAQTDQLRSGRKKSIPWQRYAAMAACLAMVLFTSYGITRLSSPKSCDSAAAAPEMLMQDLTGASNQAAPAEAEPREEPAAAAMEEAVREAEGEQELSTFAAGESDAAVSGGHAHVPGRKETGTAQGSGGWCGNMTATVFMGDEIRKLEGTQAVALADILYDLPYSEENLCRCSPEFTVDIETGDVYEINLGLYFVRYQGGQASLTEEQAAQIEEILNGL